MPEIGDTVKHGVIECEGVCSDQSCRELLFWVRTDADRPMPVNRDDPDVPHFATCANPDRFRGRAGAKPKKESHPQLTLFAGATGE